MSDMKDTNEAVEAQSGATAPAAATTPEAQAEAPADERQEQADDAEAGEDPTGEDQATSEPSDDDARAAPDAVAELRARDVGRIKALFGAPADAAAGEAGDGGFLFARWSRPLAPLFFNIERKSAETMRQGFERIARTAGLGLAAEDSELGANILVYFCEEWAELASAPQLDRLLPDLPRLLALLEAREAAEYRAFRYAEAEGVTFAVVLLRLDEALGALPPQTLALSQAVQSILLWTDGAFSDESPVAIGRHGRGVVKRWHQRLIEAAYAEDTPTFSREAALAEALADRMSAPRQPRPPRDDAELRASPEAADAAEEAEATAPATGSVKPEAPSVEPTADAAPEAHEAAAEPGGPAAPAEADGDAAKI